MSGEKAGKVASDSGVKKLILSHISPYYIANFDALKDAKKHYPHSTIVANDLMKITL